MFVGCVVQVTKDQENVSEGNKSHNLGNNKSLNSNETGHTRHTYTHTPP